MGVPITYNLRNLVERKATTLMTALGIGLTVAVLVIALALTDGLKSIFSGTGDPLQFLVLRKGADAELSSTVSADAYEIIRRFPGIATDFKGEPLVSPEALAVVNLPKKPPMKLSPR